jgi:phosphomannomutase
MTEATLFAQVRAWIADDPDQATARALTADLASAEAGDKAAQSRLADAFSGLLQFGTAGLRGALGGGPNRMNRAVVIRTAAALMHYLQDVLGLGRVPRVVIGYDARRGSATFAQDTAAVVTGAGGEALLLPGPLPTPVLAFAVRRLFADAGVMVTASHNPATDNGYKVYLGGRVVTAEADGVQLVAPHDVEIASRLAQIKSIAEVPRAESGWTVLSDSIRAQYVSAVVTNAGPGSRDLRIVHTALHGVGGQLALDILHTAGFTDVHVVAEQAEPDPDFPTAPFPNPEEPGAIDLALALAARVDADLVLANDPDADRCAAAVFDLRLGAWRMLHGDEIGALLGEQAAHQTRLEPSDKPGVLANSIVSSRLLGRIAAEYGLDHAETLTGFKWIARVDNLAYGYEEAIGYCVAPNIVRDKDGLSTALALANLAAATKAAGHTLIDLLDNQARRHGLHLTDQVSLRFADSAQLPTTIARLRSAPPATLGTSPVVEVTDLASGSANLPPTDGIRFLAQDDTRVVVRPSGTEPKVKCYLEVIEPVPASDDDAVTAARLRARERLDEVATQFRSLLSFG